MTSVPRPHSGGPDRRDALVDGLRGAAIIGVVLVNAAGYAAFPDTVHVVPPPAPAGDPLAIAAAWTVMSLLEAKAYPLLSFLFGVGFAMSMHARGERAIAHRRRRMGRLLILGILHGMLIYAGDVLTAYALCGFVLLAFGRRRLRSWLRIAAIGWGVTGLLVVGAVAVLLGVHTMTDWPPPTATDQYGLASSYAAHVAMSVRSYLPAQLTTALFVAPGLIALMAMGVIAARLRLLTHPRWRRGWARQVRWLLPVGLAANALLATLSVQAGAVEQDLPAPWVPLLQVAGPLLSAGYVAAAVAWRPRTLLALAGAGRLTLSIYLASSVIFLAVLGGAGLGWGSESGTVLTLAIGLGTCAVLLGLAHVAARAGLRGLPERWLSS